MSMFDDISWRSKDNKREFDSNAQLVSLFARRFGAGQWSFLGPGSEKVVASGRRRARKGPEPAGVQSPFFFTRRR